MKKLLCIIKSLSMADFLPLLIFLAVCGVAAIVTEQVLAYLQDRDVMHLYFFGFSAVIIVLAGVSITQLARIYFKLNETQQHKKHH